MGFEASVRVRNENKNKLENEIDNNKIQNRSNIYNRSNLLEDNQMRDIYNRKKKLEYWIGKIYSILDKDDQNDVLKFLEIMQEKDQSILTITRCISIIIQIRKQIDKPLSKVAKDDIKLIFQWMDNKRYKVETLEKYRAVFKKILQNGIW